MNEDNELLDLCNSADDVIGTIKRGDYGRLEQEKLGFIRSVNCFIISSEGKLWIPRRTQDKRIAPSGLDFSMAEHVGSGESYLQACIRGFAEELNISVSSDKLEFVATSRPHSGLYYFDTLYLYKSDEVPKYNPNDFTEYFWLDLSELLKRLNSGEPAKSSIKYWVEFLLKS